MASLELLEIRTQIRAHKRMNAKRRIQRKKALEAEMEKKIEEKALHTHRVWREKKTSSDSLPSDDLLECPTQDKKSEPSP